MLDVALMIEGQDGLTWERWQRLVLAAERLGFAGIYRSDHFTNPTGPHLPSLELWTSFTWAASHTERIEFGPLVSPVSFRHPVVTAWTAAAIDDLSGGRFQLGLGAGWQEREHTSYGFELLDIDGRFARFEEALSVVRALLTSDTEIAFDGAHFHLEHALLLPRPTRPGGPPIVIGGNGPRRTLPLAARFAAEWNAVYVTADRFRELNGRLDDLLDASGRTRTQVRRSLMTRAVVGRTRAEAESRLDDPAGLRDRGGIVGAPEDLIEQLHGLAAAGAQRVMLQWLDLDDLAGVELIGTEVLPALAS